MRILFLEGHDGTFYHFHRELAGTLLKKNYEIFVSAPYGEFTNDIKAMGCEFINSPVKRRAVNPFADFKLFIYYIKLFKKLKPDIVLTYTIKPNVYGGMACRASKIPYIANITGLGTAIENSGILRFIAIMLYKSGLKGAKCVFFQNQQNYNLFIGKKILRDGKARLIPGSGVNLTKHALEPYPDDDSNLRFLFIGRIMRDKGINELLNVFKNINNKNIFLDIVGGCEEDEYISKLAAAHEINKNIIYHGSQRDVNKFYRNAHCVILPTYHEGMSNVLQEAAAAGRPVIASKIPGCMETFEDGVTGFGCEPKSAESLEHAVKKFLNLSQDERREMGLKGRSKIEREFDRSIVVNTYIDGINNALK